jgi:hypothetical protein
MSRELLKKVLALPRRIEPLGGQNYSYVCLDDVTGIIEAELAKPKPEPNAFVPIHPVHGPLWANCSPEINENFPKNYSVMEVYTQPQSHELLPGQAIVECLPELLKPIFFGLEDEFFEFARAIEKALYQQ